MGTASNQDKTIATTGSTHIARSGPPDVCWIPGKKAVVAPGNEVPTTRATEHTTPKTVVSGAPVVQKSDAIGPPSDPAHPGTDGGVVSATYRKEARVTSGSPNVRTEGNQPSRHVDPTTQNHSNTTGTLIDTTQAPAANAAPRKPEERCTVTELVLACAHGRTTTPTDPFLDVLEGETVTATSTRRDLLKPGEPLAVCPPVFPGRHPKTKFTITRSGPDAKDKKGPESFQGIDVKQLTPADWVGGAPEPGVGASATPSISVGTPGTPGVSGHVGPKVLGPPPAPANSGFRPPAAPASQEQQLLANEYVRNKANGTPQPYGTVSPDMQATRNMAVLRDQENAANHARVVQQAQAANDAATQNAARLAARVKAVVAGADTAKSLYEIINVYKAKPKVITIEAQGCAGSQTRTLRSYPKGEKNCDLMKLKEIAAAFEAFKMVFQVAETASKAIGLGNFTFKILDPISSEFRISWQELERQSPRDTLLTKQRCYLEFELAVGGSLVDFKVMGRVPIAQFLGGIPGAARLANWVRDKFNVAADIVCTLKLGLAVAFSLKRNRYKEITLSGVEVIPSIDISIGFSLVAVKASVTVVVGAKVAPRVTITQDPTKFAIVTLVAGKATIYVKATLQYDILGWKDEISGEWTLAEIPYGQQSTDLAAWMA